MEAFIFQAALECFSNAKKSAMSMSERVRFAIRTAEFS
jgi:hypothetical protein